MIANEVFSCYVFYSVLLVLKLHLIGVITGQIRLRKKAFANPEDAIRHGGMQYYRMDPLVERCRRAHLNDLENILPFLFLGSIYALSGPPLYMARAHFMIFSLSRLMHSIAYLLIMRAPIRSMCHVIGQMVCFSMAMQILLVVHSFA